MTLIQARVSERVGTIAFDNYAKRNAFTTGLIEEVIAALDQFEAQGVRVVARARGFVQEVPLARSAMAS